MTWVYKEKWAINSTANSVTQHWISVQNSITQLIPSAKTVKFVTVK